MWGQGAEKVQGKGVEAIESIRHHMPHVFMALPRSKNGNVVVVERNPQNGKVEPYWLNLEESYRASCGLVEPFTGMTGYWDRFAWGVTCKEKEDGLWVTMNQAPQVPIHVKTKEGRTGGYFIHQGQEVFLSHVWVECLDSWKTPVKYIEIVGITIRGERVVRRIYPS